MNEEMMQKIRFPKTYVWTVMGELNGQSQKVNGRLKEIQTNKTFWDPTEKNRQQYILAPSQEKFKAFLGEERWEWVTDYGNDLAVYCSTARHPKVPQITGQPEEGELTQVLISTRRKIERKGRRPILLGMEALILLLMAFIADFGGRFASVLQYDWVLGLIPLYILAILLLILRYVRQQREIKAWWQLWQQEGELAAVSDKIRAKWKLPAALDTKGKGRAKVLFVLCTVLLGLELMQLLAGLVGTHRGSLVDAPFDYVTLSSIEERAVEPKVMEDYANTYVRRGSVLVPLQQEIRQSGVPTGDTESVAMRTMEYRCAGESLAHELLMGRMRTQLSWNSLISGEEVVGEDWTEMVDEAYRAGYQSMQYLFLRKGNRVMTVFYLGDQNLAEMGRVFAEYLNQ